MVKNKKVKILIISILCILTLAIGLSYGYYLLNRIQENGNVAGSKCFNLEFTNEKNAINLDNMYPISDEEGKKLTPYSFTITNTCDMLAGYTVNMEMLEGTTLNSKYLDVMVNNEEIKLLTNYESTDTVINGSTESRILAKGTLAYNDSVDYTVRFWMDKDVEDVDSMNKYFASKIVVVATPSSWNPKDAGYDTLHDAILANEYQTTPEDALSKIEAKGTPDFSKTAPIIKWSEKKDNETTKEVIKPALTSINSNEATSKLTDRDTKVVFYKTVSFNSENSIYTLSNPVYIDPTELNYNDSETFYFIFEEIRTNADKFLYTSSFSGSRTIYEVKGATKELSNTSWDDVSYQTITYKLSLQSLNSVELEIDKSDKGLYKADDDYGTTYYYRGNVKNNNVYFGGYYWQIVRINGDGSIRMIYNGSEKNATGIKQSINNKMYNFNEKIDSPAFVGYMYGDRDATTFEKVHSNLNDSNIKINIDNWYKINIYDKGISNYLSYNTGFCGDRTLYDGDGISTSKITKFAAYGRNLKKVVQFTCPNINMDLYTSADSNIGNKSLIYPIGLITYDELVFAGMNSAFVNQYSYLYSSMRYWTMTPSVYQNYSSLHWVYNGVEKTLSPWFRDDYKYGVRPVINLKSDVKITGGIGTTNDPFVIDTN